MSDHFIAGATIRSMMRAHKISIWDLASRMTITLKRVRDVRATGVVGECMCLDWHEAITGSGVYADQQVTAQGESRLTP